MSSDSLIFSLPEDLVRRLFTALPDKSSKRAFSATARHIRLAILPELTVTLKVTAEQLQNSCAAENPLLNFPRGATLKALVIKASGSGPSPFLKEFWLRELLEQGHDEQGSRIKATLQNVSSLTVQDSSAPMKNGLRCILYAHLPNLRELRLERGPASMGSGRNAHTHYLSFLDFVATNESLSMMVCLHDVRLESLPTVVRGFCNLRVLYVSFDYISQPGFAAKMLPICAEAQLYQDHPIQIRLEADSSVGAGDEVHMHIAAELKGLELTWQEISQLMYPVSGPCKVDLLTFDAKDWEDLHLSGVI